MSYFLYKFTPRSDFAQTMTEHEAAIMKQHVAYWQTYADNGTALVFSPVADPAGSWGMAVVRGDTIDDVYAIRAGDPVVAHGLGPVTVFAMPSAITGRWQSPER